MNITLQKKRKKKENKSQVSSQLGVPQGLEQ